MRNLAPLLVALTGALTLTACEREADVVWLGAPSGCDGESCGAQASRSCVVDGIEDDDKILLTLLCDNTLDPEGSPTTEFVELKFSPGGELDLDEGDTVELGFRNSSGFELGGRRATWIRDDKGELVAAACDAYFYGGVTGIDDSYAEAVDETFSPFSSTVTPTAGGYRVILSQDDAKAKVRPGGVDHLDGTATWLVISADDDEGLQVGIMRLRD